MITPLPETTPYENSVIFRLIVKSFIIMTKRYTILQKKLQQLQTELALVFALPVDQTSYHQLLSDGIEQRFEFLKNLLSAEITSHPLDPPPHHLVHIDQRLAQLESAFRKWEECCNSVYANNVDNGSVCSCTESFLNDDGDSFSSLNMDVPEFGSFPSVGELRLPEGFYGGPVVAGYGERMVMNKDNGFFWTWRYCAKMVFYLLLGASLIVMFLTSFGYSDQEGYFTPT